MLLRCPSHAQVRKFKAVNTGFLGVTFAMDTKAMEKSGFTVTPDKMPLLAGAPIHASLELTVTLQVSQPSSLLLLLLLPLLLLHLQYKASRLLHVCPAHITTLIHNRSHLSITGPPNSQLQLAMVPE